jgi:hypothetical protein
LITSALRKPNFQRFGEMAPLKSSSKVSTMLPSVIGRSNIFALRSAFFSPLKISVRSPSTSVAPSGWSVVLARISSKLVIEEPWSRTYWPWIMLPICLMPDPTM